MNTTTKPLFEETLSIVLECFEKYKKKRPLLPIECLKNYQLIYDESDDEEKLLQDDNQVFSERAPMRYSVRDIPSRLSFQRSLPRLGTSRTSMTTLTVDTSITNEPILPVVNEVSTSPNLTLIEEPKPANDNVENDRLVKAVNYFKTKYSYARPTRSFEQLTKGRVKRSLSSNNASTFTRTKRIDLKPILREKRLNKQKLNVTTIATTIVKNSQENENQVPTEVSATF